MVFLDVLFEGMDDVFFVIMCFDVELLMEMVVEFEEYVNVL